MREKKCKNISNVFDASIHFYHNNFKHTLLCRYKHLSRLTYVNKPLAALQFSFANKDSFVVFALHTRSRKKSRAYRNKRNKHTLKSFNIRSSELLMSHASKLGVNSIIQRRGKKLQSQTFCSLNWLFAIRFQCERSNFCIIISSGNHL